ADLGMLAADRGVVEDDFEMGHAPGPEQVGGFPHLPRDVAAQAAQTDAVFHDGLPPSSRPRQCPVITAALPAYHRRQRTQRRLGRQLPADPKWVTTIKRCAGASPY